MADRKLVERLASLFEGYSSAHGTYAVSKTSRVKGGKVDIKPGVNTVRTPPTLDLWEEHVNGERPIGIIPIREDDCCLWGVVDVDRYDLSLPEVVAEVEKNELPMIVCRSKSGGAHVFLFLSEPTPADVVIEGLREISALLGHGNSEVFPKQRTIDRERGDLGNWLNMPYFGGDDTDRYGVKSSGSAMTLEEFVRRAESLRQPTSFFDRTFRKKPKEDTEFGDGPPCMQHLVAMGFPEGTRNKGLFALATFAKRKYPDRWQDVVEDWNRRFMTPPLPSEEVVQVIRSHEKKDYQYTCKELPISSHCNSGLCRTRVFGVGGDGQYPVLSGIRKLESDPPLWFVDVEDQTLELNTDQLLNYRQFHRACMEQFNVVYKLMKQDTWLDVLTPLVREAVPIQVPEEVGNKGQFYELLEEFLMNRHRGESKEDLFLGKPFESEEDDCHYFRLQDLQRFLDMANFKVYNRPVLASRLRDIGGGRHQFNVKGKGVNVWWVPRKFKPIPESTIPRAEGEQI